jgi:hypothetical protein
MQKSAPRSPGFVDELFTENFKVLAVVRFLVTLEFQDAGPATAEPNDLVTLSESPDGDCPDGWIQSGDVSAARQDTDYAFRLFDICHWKKPPSTIARSGCCAGRDLVWQISWSHVSKPV